jgi:hypothetical protein
MVNRYEGRAGIYERRAEELSDTAIKLLKQAGIVRNLRNNIRYLTSKTSNESRIDTCNVKGIFSGQHDHVYSKNRSAFEKIVNIKGVGMSTLKRAWDTSFRLVDRTMKKEEYEYLNSITMARLIEEWETNEYPYKS